jgi:hypothetical protein
MLAVAFGGRRFDGFELGLMPLASLALLGIRRPRPTACASNSFQADCFLPEIP